MTHTFIIAEAGSSHDNDLQKGYRLIEAAKECGADAIKFQWTSNAGAMASRRGLGADAANMYAKYLQYPLEKLRHWWNHAESVGIEFMCTAFIPEDLDAVASLATTGKISAFESGDQEMLSAARARFDRLIVSFNPGKPLPNVYDIEILYCISKYPTQMEDLKLGRVNFKEGVYDGLSDHTTSTLTGAFCVAAGGQVIEKHIRLHDTDPKNPDYGHSLVADPILYDHAKVPLLVGSAPIPFAQYVANIREAERCM